MSRQDKGMIIITVVLLMILIFKSFYFDPIDAQQGEEALFHQYALEVAPIVHQPLIFRKPIVVYRMTSLKHDPQGENTIIYTFQEEIAEEITLEGTYVGRIKIYLLGVLPYREVTIKGGIDEWKQN